MVLAADAPIVGTGRDYTHLVQDYRVHGSLYTDPAVFADEMKRIFTDGWVFVGHESEIPGGGDWVARRLGTERVLMARAHDGEISVVANRCAHRGTTLCPQSEGNSRNFRCPYHAWTYDLDGMLLGAPFPQRFANEKPDVRLDQPGQVGIYRGFVFANQSGTAGPLSEHLGSGGSDLIDRAADMSPTGRLQLRDVAIEAEGAEKAKQIMWDGPPHAFVFPNLFLGEMNIARIDPLAPGLTEHYHTPLLVESSDLGINRRVILQSEAVMGPGGARSPSSSSTRRCSQTSRGTRSGLTWSPTTFTTGCRSGPVTTSRTPG
ncbi:aromatic ring-hydroxylating oxygenase subunit alpha [Candidatus Poriferisodalis sp.]|uniref:aromatic ring-hydroxylating oxygenase subunit alpha n=1 Tax=Candidatus Poriferisodalis sp. TaxID=3101277 RepID=UPI003B5ABC39